VRGATISGAVTYDDGNPAIAATLHLLVRQRNSKWGEANLVLTGLRQWASFATRTDDLGRFCISGLVPGTYALDVSISTTNMTFSKLQLGGGSLQSSTRTGQTLHIYSGNRLNQNDAAPIVVTASGDRADSDIVIPLSHLHTVSGTGAGSRKPTHSVTGLREDQHWSVVHEYVDRTSGKRCDREQFQKMFGAASRREFDVLVFRSLDRPSRADQTKREKMGHLVS
jgi:hypothetical protein